MRVISAQVLGTDGTLLEAFRHHLIARDLAPTTIRAYLSDLEQFRTWRSCPRSVRLMNWVFSKWVGAL